MRNISSLTLREAFRRALVLSPFVVGGCAGGPPAHNCPDASVVITAPATPSDGGCMQDCNLVASGLVVSCFPETLSDGGPGILCNTVVPCTGITGRRPASLRPASFGATPRAAGHPVGTFFAECARLEAASVEAFRVLREELAAHGAPVAFARACDRAAADEARHTRAMGKLARRYGVVPLDPAYHPGEHARSLEAIALENATEGCARETYGALCAHWQAAHAADAQVARTLRMIARDEARHAALSWRVADWIEPKLSPGRRRVVADAHREAFGALREELGQEVPPECIRMAGLPAPRVATELLDSLIHELA